MKSNFFENLVDPIVLHVWVVVSQFQWPSWPSETVTLYIYTYIHSPSTSCTLFPYIEFRAISYNAKKGYLFETRNTYFTLVNVMRIMVTMVTMVTIMTIMGIETMVTMVTRDESGFLSRCYAWLQQLSCVTCRYILAVNFCKAN